MDQFKDRLVFDELKNSEEFVENNEDFNTIKDIVNEMKQMLEIEINNEDKHHTEDTQQVVKDVKCEDQSVINKEEVKTQTDEDLDSNEVKEIKSNELIIGEDVKCEDQSVVNKEEVKTQTDEVLDSNEVKEIKSNELIKELISELEKNVVKTRMTKTDKWGETLDIFDANGVQKRIIDLNDLNNYLKFESRHKCDFNYYLSLVTDRYPRFHDSTNNYYQRWRMRYNVFVDNVFESAECESLLHLGEIHLYFDLIPRSSRPTFINTTFYGNQLPIEIPLKEDIIPKVKQTFDSMRFSNDLFQLKFPIAGQVFINCNKIFDKFMERQTEFIEEAQKVYRKGFQRRSFGRAINQSNARNDSNYREPNHANERNFGRNERDFSGFDRNRVQSIGDRDVAHNERGFGRNDRNMKGFYRKKPNSDLAQNSNNVNHKSVVDMGFNSRNISKETPNKYERPQNDSNMASNINQDFNQLNRNKKERKFYTSGPKKKNTEQNSGRNNGKDFTYDYNRRRTSDPFVSERGDSSTFKREFNQNKQTIDESVSESNSRSNFPKTYRQ